MRKLQTVFLILVCFGVVGCKGKKENVTLNDQEKIEWLQAQGDPNSPEAKAEQARIAQEQGR